jgi:hypothetical protein
VQRPHPPCPRPAPSNALWPHPTPFAGRRRPAQLTPCSTDGHRTHAQAKGSAIFLKTAEGDQLVARMNLAKKELDAMASTPR